MNPITESFLDALMQAGHAPPSEMVAALDRLARATRAMAEKLEDTDGADFGALAEEVKLAIWSAR